MDEKADEIKEVEDSEMKPEQFDLTNQLFGAVYNVADALGSEASEVAQLVLTSRKNLKACKAYFPSSFKAESLTEDQFTAASRDADSAKALLETIPDASKEFGVFREDNNSSWFCVFWNSTAQIGSNAFFRAHRVET